jgi:hypothetical protein
MNLHHIVIVPPTGSVADPGCLSRIRVFSIPDPGSRSATLPLGQMDGAPEPEEGVQMERICMDVDGADLPFSDKCQCLK